MMLKFKKQLFKVYELKAERVQFYMDATGAIHWATSNDDIKRLSALPLRLQVPFMVKFIRNHHLAEKLRYIEDPLVGIEVYIKANFLENKEKESGC